MARAVFSSSSSQLTVAVGKWCAGDKGDKAGDGRDGAGRREDWLRCWGECESIRVRGEKRLGRILYGAVAIEAHVTWKGHQTSHTG
jgi:hypothetical protein